MNDYKARVVVEYKQLRDRCDKLQTMLDRHANGTLGFTPDCPIELLSKQALAMLDYKTILEERAKIEHITLG